MTNDPSAVESKSSKAGVTPTGLSALENFYEEKAAVYHTADSSIGQREKRVLELFPARKNLRVLDVGCGAGRFLRVLKDLGHQGVGLEISQSATKFARESGVNAFYGNAETKEGLDDVGTGFDVITALDVLEHTFDPAKVLEHLTPLLKKDGCIIASVPNVGCVIGRTTILRGKFPAHPSGIFDSGHIRWFTRNNLDLYIQKTSQLKLVACTGTPLPSMKRAGLWRTEKLQNIFFRSIAQSWPSLWGFQLVFKVVLKV